MRRIYQFLFIKLIRYTPESWGRMRTFFVRKYAKHVGAEVNVGRKCFIHKNTKIGDCSGVGYACEINNGVTIGRNRRSRYRAHASKSSLSYSEKLLYHASRRLGLHRSTHKTHRPCGKKHLLF